MMTQNVNRRLQSPLRMVAVERLPNPLLGPVNQPLRLLQSELNQPRMRPGQLAQITRRNIQLTGGGADIRVMLHQQTLNPREIKPTATRRNRKPPNRRPPPHSNAHPTDRRKTRSRSTNSARRNEASSRRRRSKTRLGRGCSLAGKGEERRARNPAIRGPASPCRQRYPSPRRRKQCRQQRWSS
jgi:hypothetical protein